MLPMLPMLTTLLLLVCGALAAALLYLACILTLAGLRLYRVERGWTLLGERATALSGGTLT